MYTRIFSSHVDAVLTGLDRVREARAVTRPGRL